MTAANNGTSDGIRVVVDEGGSVVTAERAPSEAGLSRTAARYLQAGQNIKEWRRKELEKIDRERKEKLRRVRSMAGDARDHIDQRFIPLGLLKPSPTAQRDLNEDRALRLAENWVWTKCQALTVVPADDGTYEIIDGQHRWWAAWVTFDKDKELPCDVLVAVPTSDDVAKAGHFLDINTNRRALTGDTVFAKMLLAHRPEALTVVRVLESRGLELLTKSGGRRQARDGEVLAGSTLLRLVREVGEAGLREIVRTLYEGWGISASAYSAHALTGTAQFLSRYWADPNFRFEQLVGLMQRANNTPQAVEARASRFLSALNGRRPAAFACAIHEIYNAGRVSIRKLPPFPMESEGRHLNSLLVKFGRSVAQRAA
ncbi:MAG TPA: DUF6551 family protein [Chloroflexota bacterium]|nr:DUF6551 family protein [Chloroflexota bacterium]